MAGTGLTGFLENLKSTEILIIALVALVVLGPERIPEMARGAGKMLNKLRTMTEGAQSELRDVMADPSMQPLKELGELAARPRQKLTEYALEAEAEERAKREAKIAAQQQDAADDADESSEQGAEADDTAEVALDTEQDDSRTVSDSADAAAPDASAELVPETAHDESGERADSADAAGPDDAATPSDVTDAGAGPGSSLP